MMNRRVLPIFIGLLFAFSNPGITHQPTDEEIREKKAEQLNKFLQNLAKNEAKELHKIAANDFDYFFKNYVRVVDIANEFFIVESDLVIHGMKQLRDYHKQLATNETSFGFELRVDVSNKKPSKWPIAMRKNLTYCVPKTIKGLEVQGYKDMVDAIHTAASQWEKAADVDFIHEVHLDSDCDSTQADVVFNVALLEPECIGTEQGQKHGCYCNQLGAYATAFFPNDENRNNRKNRELLVNSYSMLSGLCDEENPITLTGLMTHELGHILGFGHEHKSGFGGASSCNSGYTSTAVTVYDDVSVMLSPADSCRDRADWESLSQWDKIGSACFYDPSQSFPEFNEKHCVAFQPSK